MIKELEAQIWEKIFWCANCPSPVVHSECHILPFDRENVEFVLDMNEKEKCIAGQLFDERWFIIFDAGGYQFCYVTHHLADLYYFGMTDEMRVFLPKVEELARKYRD